MKTLLSLIGGMVATLLFCYVLEIDFSSNGYELKKQRQSIETLLIQDSINVVRIQELEQQDSLSRKRILKLAENDKKIGIIIRDASAYEIDSILSRYIDYK